MPVLTPSPPSQSSSASSNLGIAYLYRNIPDSPRCMLDALELLWLGPSECLLIDHR